MKTQKKTNYFLLAGLLFLFLGSGLKAQIPLYNNLTCDVTVNVEIGDITTCPPSNNTPCNWYVVTIPQGGIHWVLPCGGPIHELCVTVLDIGGTTILNSHTHNSVGCCSMANTGIAGTTPSCSRNPWNISRIPGVSWTIQ